MPDQPDQFVDMKFPTGGVDLSQGFASQGQGTTPIGQNVRTFEPSTLRGRGGSRPGTSKYIAAQLPSGPNVIQHLNVIVDPQGGALLDQDAGSFPDPSDAGPAYAWGIFGTRNPGRLIRQGGSGWMEFKNKKPKGFHFIQGNDNHGGPGAPYLRTTPFHLSTTAGNLLIVASGATTDPSALVLPTDSFGTSFNLITHLQSVEGFSSWAAIWYGIAVGTGPNSIIMDDGTGFGLPGLVIAEYSGQGVLPLDGSETNDTHVDSWPGVPQPFPFTSGPISVGSAGELVVSYSVGGQTASVGCSFNGSPGFTTRLLANDATKYNAYPNVILQDVLAANTTATANSSQTSTPGQIGAELLILSVSASFRKAT